MIKDDLLKILMNNTRIHRYTNNGREFIIRCPECGDSIKNENSAHLYICIDNEEKGFPYYCQRCGFSGYVNKDFLSMLDIYDDYVSKELTKINRKKSFNSKIVSSLKHISNIRAKMLIPKPEHTKLNAEKILYLRNRFGIDLSLNDLIDKYKVIFSMNQFIEYNNIKFNPNSKINLDLLESCYVGFLSNDKSHIIFRDFTGQTSMRYINYNIFDEYEDVNKMYTISGSIDISKHVNIYCTEGIMDIISVYNNFKVTTSNNIFISANGKGYKNLLLYLTRRGICDCTLNIFSDNDVDIKNYIDLKRFNVLFRENNINIYYNEYNGEKDFGVHKDKIIFSNKIPLQ